MTQMEVVLLILLILNALLTVGYIMLNEGTYRATDRRMYRLEDQVASLYVWSRRVVRPEK